jgi:TPR repeat protein
LYYQKAAEAGSSFAIFRLGQMYESGRGVAQDYSKAFQSYRKAAMRGFVPAQLSVARMYEQGLGTQVNYVNAYVFYSLASRRDSLAAAQHFQQVSKKMTADQRQQAETLLDKIHERFITQQTTQDDPS